MKDIRRHLPSRRDCLVAAGGAAASAACLPILSSAQGAALPFSKDCEPLLVLIQLTGGNDALSTLVPYADRTYAKVRSATRIGADEVHKLDASVGLHPNLGGLAGLFRAGELALVFGTGYPHSSRSHFEAMEVWQAGDPRGHAAGAGWIGRACDAAFGAERALGSAVHVGGRAPFALGSRGHRPIAFQVPEGYRWVGSEAAVEAYDERFSAPHSATGTRLDFLRGVLGDARASSAAVRQAALEYRSAVPYPADPFAEDLRAVAALAHSGLGVRVASVELTGFDTHAGQRGAHDALMRRLDEGLCALLADLALRAPERPALALVFSEFGRRVRENGSRGTDHGRAGIMLLAGKRVRGGLYGGYPNLADLDDGDLAVTTDFRSVYAAVVEATFGVDPVPILGTFPRIKLLG
jgi:uncharacterized protein (DUF1501 family)